MASDTYRRFRETFDMRDHRIGILMGVDGRSVRRWASDQSPMTGAPEQLALSLLAMMDAATPDAAWHLKDLVRQASCMGGLPMLIRLLAEEYLINRCGGGWRQKKVPPPATIAPPDGPA